MELSDQLNTKLANILIITNNSIDLIIITSFIMKRGTGTIHHLGFSILL